MRKCTDVSRHFQKRRNTDFKILQIRKHRKFADCLIEIHPCAMTKNNSFQMCKRTHIGKRSQWIIFQKQVKTFLRIIQRKVYSKKSAVSWLWNIQHLRLRTKSEEWKVKSKNWHCNSCNSSCSLKNFNSCSFHGCKYVTHFYCHSKFQWTVINEAACWKLVTEKSEIKSAC